MPQISRCDPRPLMPERRGVSHVSLARALRGGWRLSGQALAAARATVEAFGRELRYDRECRKVW